MYVGLVILNVIFFRQSVNTCRCTYVTCVDYQFLSKDQCMFTYLDHAIQLALVQSPLHSKQQSCVFDISKISRTLIAIATQQIQYIDPMLV